MKLSDKLDKIRRMHPKGPTPFGQIYSVKAETSKRYRKVTLYTLFVSDENTHLLRPHVFDSGKIRNAKQWAGWFAENLTDIHIKAILPGIGIRTQKSWSVKRILGWSGNAKHVANNSRVAKQRNKTKSSRLTRGQINIRRRHRNGRRKAK